MTAPESAVEALDKALDGAMATAGLAVKPSHYTRHVMTRLTEQGYVVLPREAVGICADCGHTMERHAWTGLGDGITRIENCGDDSGCECGRFAGATR